MTFKDFNAIIVQVGSVRSPLKVENWLKNNMHRKTTLKKGGFFVTFFITKAIDLYYNVLYNKDIESR